MHTPIVKAKDVWSQHPSLSSTAKLLAAILNRTRREHTECWLSTRSLAERIGRSLRTVQLALAELARAALVRVVRSYELQSRRRIVLLWRVEGAVTPSPTPPPTPSRPHFLGARNCAHSAQSIAPSPGVPPDPPIEEPEGTVLREIESSGSAGVETSSPDCPPGSPVVSEPPPHRMREKTPQTPSLPAGSRRATPDEIRGLEAKAERILGAGWWSRRFARTRARQYRLLWVNHALDRTADAIERRTLKGKPVCYCEAVLRRIAEDGGLPPEPPPPPPPVRKSAPPSPQIPPLFVGDPPGTVREVDPILQGASGWPEVERRLIERGLLPGRVS